MSVAEAQRILLQKDQAEPIIKLFRPSKMCDKYRIIHYIVSRCIINKSYSFTYLSQEDCVMLARIIRGDKLDIGELIFNLMKDFSSSKWQTEALIPIPQVVSYIVKRLNIAHLQGEEKKKIDSFDLTHLRRMKLELPYNPSRSMLPPEAKEKKKKEGAPEAVPEEIQNKAQPSTAPPPSTQQFAVELGAKIDSVLTSLKSELAEMKTSQSAIFASLESELAELKDTQGVILEKQNQMQHEIDDIKNLVLLYINKSYGPSISEEDLDRPTENPEASTPVQSPVPEPSPEHSHEPTPKPPSEHAPQPSSEPAPQLAPIEIISSPEIDSDPQSPIHPLAIIPYVSRD